MPPAFVLSQDQTLMFNPSGSFDPPIRSMPRTRTRTLPRAFTTLTPRHSPSTQAKPPTSQNRTASARTSTTPPPPAHPFPYTNNVNQQQSVPEGTSDPTANAADATFWPEPDRQTREGPWRTVKIVASCCPVQGPVSKKFPV